MKNVLISMCLCDIPCRYDGKAVPFGDALRLSEKFNLIPVCPEIIGGLSTPRAPAERVDDKVLTAIGEDVSEQFHNGAQSVLKIAKSLNCEIAILKEFSPSCGVNFIYDGSFSGNKIAGEGITTQLLKENGIDVYSDLDIQKFIKKYL